MQIKNEIHFKEAKRAFYAGKNWKGLSGFSLEKELHDYVTGEDIREDESNQFFGVNTFLGKKENKATIKKIKL